METFKLTEKELKAAVILFENNGCGAQRPSDFENDEYTYIAASDLVGSGYTKHEAAGLFSSLDKKGFIYIDSDPDEVPYITTDGWKWLDTVWDEIKAKV